MAGLISKPSIGKHDVWGKLAFLIFHVFALDIYFLPPSLDVFNYFLRTLSAIHFLCLHLRTYMPNSSHLIIVTVDPSPTHPSSYLHAVRFKGGFFFFLLAFNTPRAQLGGALHVRITSLLLSSALIFPSTSTHCFSFFAPYFASALSGEGGQV